MFDTPINNDDEENEDEEDSENETEKTGNKLEDAITAIKKVCNFDYSVSIEKDSQINAYATPDKRIVLTSRAVDELSEEELAFVVAHEYAHHELEHIKKSIGVIDTVTNELKEIGKSKQGGLAKTIESIIVSAFGFVSYFGCRQLNELEADSLAKKIITEAGYSEYAFEKFFNRFQSSGGLFSSHPSSDMRKDLLKK